MAQCVVIFEQGSGAVCMLVWRKEAPLNPEQRKDFIKRCIKRVLDTADTPIRSSSSSSSSSSTGASGRSSNQAQIPSYTSGVLACRDLKAVYHRYGAVFYMAASKSSVMDWVTMRLLDTFYNRTLESLGKADPLLLKTNFDKVLSILNGCLLQPFAHTTPPSRVLKGDSSSCRVVMNNVKGSFVVGSKVIFVVSTVGAGEGVIEADVREEGSEKLKSVRVQDLTDTMKKIIYKTTAKGDLLMTITFNEEDIEGSPFSFSCVEPDPEAVHCKAEGEALQFAKQGRQEHFALHGPGSDIDKVQVLINKLNGEKTKLLGRESSDLSEITIDRSPNHMNTFDIAYTIQQAGQYELQMLWDGFQIPGSPFKIKCHPLADAKKFSLLASSPVKAGSLYSCTIQASEDSDKTAELSAVIIGPEHTIINRHNVERHQADGTEMSPLTFTPKSVGKYQVNAYADGNHIQGSPFKLKTFCPTGVHTRGPGLKDVLVGQEGNFSIDTSKGGDGNLVVMVHGPKGGFDLSLEQDKQSKRIVWGSYFPTHSGSYLVDVLWTGEHVPGSPFKVQVTADSSSLPLSPHQGVDVATTHD